MQQNCNDAASYFTRVADKAVASAQGGQAPFIEKKRLSDGARAASPHHGCLISCFVFSAADSNSGNGIGENEDVLMYYEQVFG